MKKIAFVNQRYGLEVNGGSEYYTMLMAERLSKKYEVSVLTTRAIDYVTWENYYNQGKEIINGVEVIRFSVDRCRDKDFNIFNRKYMLHIQNHGRNIEMEKKWFDKQGPLSTDLIKYIEDNKDLYDAFIFVTYLYYHSVKGLAKVANKSIFIPTAHEEPYIHFKTFEKIFKLPKAYIFLTNEEKNLVHEIFHNDYIKYDVLGTGVDIPAKIDCDLLNKKYNLNEYIIYVGRIDEGKGCADLFTNFIKYKKKNNSDLKLVLMGKAVMPIPKHEDIIYLGFVSEEEKFSGIAGAKALVMPSNFESLSMVILESMAVGTPVVVNARCKVLKGHCIKSNAGLYYEDYYEFEGIINFLSNNADVYEKMKINAKRYVDENYQWNNIINRFSSIIEYVTI